MVFTSIPAYLDSANWQQQQNHQIGSSSTNSLLPPAPQPAQPLPPQLPHATGGSGSIRLGSMAERARLASIPMPEGALRCPRCESTNTKFCYFNNYNLSQPRHFCKSCRRYWTRGGALRTVPVGGGCRRNKRSKGNNTKSPVNTDGQITTSTSTSTNTITSNDGITTNTLGLTPQIPSLRFMSPLSRFTDNYSTGDINLNYSGYAASVLGTNDTNFSVESNSLGGHSGGGMTSLLSSGGIEQWRLQQQFPSLGGLDPSPAWLYQFQGGMEQSGIFGEHTMRPKLSTSMTTQLASVKLEENPRLNSSRQFMEDDQWSTGAAWTDLSSFSSTSTRNPF